MRLPLARYGTRELIAGTVLCAALGVLAARAFLPLVVVPLGVWALLLWFFRDPERACSAGPRELLSPADGRVMDVGRVADPPLLGEPALRVGIFMSLLDCHVNRSPAAATVEEVEYHRGEFNDARSPRSATANEHNLILLRLGDGRRILLNQIAGIVARRIVCDAAPGQALEAGQRMGMIKFGSRVELFVPESDAPTPRVKEADRVKAGRDVLAGRGAAPGGPEADAGPPA
jgi:phosphatidylserine decarboxylase